MKPMDTETAEQITDSDKAEIARQVAEGLTYGTIDREGLHISWSLDAEILKKQNA